MFRAALFHGGRYGIRIHNHLALRVAGRAANRLDERRFGAQEPFLIRIEDGNERYLWDIEPFAQQVDANEHIKFALAQVADNFHALNGIDIVVHITHLDAGSLEVIR